MFLEIVVWHNGNMQSGVQACSELLTLEEARLILRFSKSKLYAERNSGRLPSRRFGARAVRIHRQDLDRYIEAAASQCVQVALDNTRPPVRAEDQ